MSDKPTFTTRDTELIVIAMKCAKDPNGFQVDYEKMAGMANLKNPKTASTIWSNVKKKLMSVHTGDADDSPSTPGTASKTKAAPKKRGPAKGRAATGADIDVEGENGVAADDEQTPTNTPKKKPSAKRKVKAENSDDNNEGCAGLDEDNIIDETPAKKKRVYNRKPKDPSAASPKPRAKKGAKEASTIPVNGDDAPNGQLMNDSKSDNEGDHESMFGDGNIKVEGPDELTEYEQYQAQKILDAQTFGFGGAYA